MLRGAITLQAITVYEHEVLRGAFQLDSIVIEHVVFAGAPSHLATQYVEVMGFAFRRAFGVYRLFSKDAQAFEILEPKYGAVLASVSELIRLLFPVRLKRKYRLEARLVMTRTTGWMDPQASLLEPSRTLQNLLEPSGTTGWMDLQAHTRMA